jgi:hypothetical protein
LASSSGIDSNRYLIVDPQRGLAGLGGLTAPVHPLGHGFTLLLLMFAAVTLGLGKSSGADGSLIIASP